MSQSFPQVKRLLIFFWLLTAYHFPGLFFLPIELNLFLAFLKITKILNGYYGVTTIFPNFDLVITVNQSPTS